MGEDGATASPGAKQPVEVDTKWAVAAAIAWAVLSFGHGYGLEFAYATFQWAKRPGTLSEAGGLEGMQVLERSMALVLGSIALLAVSGVGWRLRHVDRRKLLDELVPWALWATLLYLVWTCFIVYATELVHFAQYAVVGILIHRALKGRHPQLAFLITVTTGFVDEIWQHYGLHEWLMNDPNHIMDFSDPVLDALGASGGILLFVSLARLRGDPLPDSFHLVKRWVLGAALLFLPLLLLDPVATAKYLGHYQYFPFWGEYENHKPTHWPMPREGIPLCLAALVILGTLLEPRRRGFSQASFLLLAALLLTAINPYSRLGGTPVHEVVPETQVRYTATPIVVDGTLEATWETALRLGPFVNTLDASAYVTHGDGQQDPLLPTYARLLWDETNLYVAFEVSDPDVWARDVPRDTTTLPGDEVVEVFLDDGGDEVTYYEYEVSPRNVVYDLFNLIPFAPLDYNPDAKFIGLPQWSAQGLQTAVSVDGTLETCDGWRTPPPADEDRGWTVEMAIPWAELKTTTTPSSLTIRRKLYPQPGDRWRLGLFRVERPRIDLAALAPTGEEVSAAEGAALLGVDTKTFADMASGGFFKPGTADPAKYDKASVVWAGQKKRAQYQAWAPTWNSSFHRPPRYGVIEFVKDQPE
jgi:hypothetical protein